MTIIKLLVFTQSHFDVTHAEFANLAGMSVPRRTSYDNVHIGMASLLCVRMSL